MNGVRSWIGRGPFGSRIEKRTMSVSVGFYLSNLHGNRCLELYVWRYVLTVAWTKR